MYHTGMVGFSKIFIKRFINHFAREDNWHELDKDTGNLGYGWIHYGLIRNFKPKRVLVIGSQYGFVPAVCALGCKDNQKGVVDFVDAGYDTNSKEDRGRHWGGVGFWKKTDIKKHFGKFNLTNYLNFYLSTGREFKKKYPKRWFEYVYLDGDHSYQGVKADYKMFWPQLNKGGMMGFHDINIRKLGGFKYGVVKLWQELKEEGRPSFSLPGKFGLGFIQK